MMKYLFNFSVVAILVFLISGCVSTVDPDNAGRLRGFQKNLVKGGDFWITTYQKTTNPDLPFVFYLEGDGMAFDGKYRISSNPTPRKHTLFALATMDNRPNVIYVARPCQYTPMEINVRCNSSYWTNKRMSDDSVDSLNDVINSINKHGHKFSLVGYSGGGGMAILIAARNNRVKDIITIAGNLDHKSFTYHHKVTPMIGSLNPIDYTKNVNNIPQLHLSGGKDTIVPPFIADKFIAKASTSCVKQRIIPKASHANGWDEIWEYMIIQPITCNK